MTSRTSTQNQGSARARHTCGGPVFGRKTPGCPRCDELLAGAPAVQWRNTRREDERWYRIERAHHTCDACRTGHGFCTFGDW